MESGAALSCVSTGRGDFLETSLEKDLALILSHTAPTTSVTYFPIRRLLIEEPRAPIEMENLLEAA